LARGDLLTAAVLVAASLALAMLFQSLLATRAWIAFAPLLLLAGSGLVLWLQHARAAVRAGRVLAAAVRAHGAPLPDDEDPIVAAEAAAALLDRYRERSDAAVRELREAHERHVQEVRRAHDELLLHHRTTKRMLRSQSVEEVLLNLLQGVRDGLGFERTILGVRGPDGEIVFREGGGRQIRIGAWREDSLAARVLWEGRPFLADEEAFQVNVAHEDRLLAGAGPTLFVPVVRRPAGRRCAEIFHCADAACPAHAGHVDACWLVGHARTCGDLPAPAPGPEARRRCTRCEMFSALALLAVRSAPGGRPVDASNTRGVLSMVNEAALALEMVDLYEQMRTLSVTDGLTGLVNHREFYELLRRELERARRYGSSVSVLIVDVDDFKSYNDRYGHLEGDRALRAIAGILTRSARASDVVARYGGDEFALILPESTPGGALMLAERIKSEISSHDLQPKGASGVYLSVSIGIYCSDRGAESADQVVSRADEASYAAKFSGKNRVVVKAAHA